jgi:hypothetical protein
LDPFHQGPRFKVISVECAIEAENFYGTVLGGVLSVEGAWVEPIVRFGAKEEPETTDSVGVYLSHINHSVSGMAGFYYWGMVALDTTIEAQSSEMSLHRKNVECLLIGVT